MKPLLDLALQGSFLFDCLGVMGLGLVGLAAARLARRERSWGSMLMATGAVLLLAGRLWLLLAAALITPAVRHGMSPGLLSFLGSLPTILMTSGLAGVVWGLWGYDKLQREKAAEVI